MSQPLKVSSKSNPNAVAGAITGGFKESGRVEIHAIGAGAINQVVKAIAIARGFVAPSGHNLVVIPAFGDIKLGDEDRTMMKFIVEDK